MVIIFDFDGVFYSGEHVFDNVKDWFTKNRRAMFPNISDSEYAKIISDHPDFLEKESGSDISRYINMFKQEYPNLNISIDEYLRLQNEEIESINLEGAHFIDSKFMKEITQKFPCYVVSNSSQTHLYHYMDKLGVDPKWFKEMMSNQFESDDPSKKRYYASIIKKENANPKDVYVFGDSYKSDLKPAEELGCNTCLITDTHTLKQDVLNSVKANEKSTNPSEPTF